MVRLFCAGPQARRAPVGPRPLPESPELDADEAVGYLVKAQDIAKAKGKSPARYLLAELPYRLQRDTRRKIAPPPLEWTRPVSRLREQPELRLPRRRPLVSV